jgi:beta-lactamase regulating signal transducer with metallopeptidase domain
MIQELGMFFKELASPVSYALLHSLWQAALIGSLLAFSLALLKNADSRLRYGLSCLALIMVLACTISTGVYLAYDNTSMATTSSQQIPAPATDDARAASVQLDTGIENTAWIVPPGISDELIGWLFPIWLIGVWLLSVKHAVGWRKAQWLAGRGTADIGREWTERCNRLCAKLGVSQSVRLVTSTLVRVPCVVGWVKPVILVPVATLAGLDTDELEMILVHELAHIRRHDTLINGIQVLVETLLFFNPAVWWISRQIRLERENCCDDLAATYAGDHVLYARVLTRLEELRGPSTGFAVAATGSSLLQRVKRLTGLSTDRKLMGGVGMTSTILLAIVIAFGFGMLGGAPTTLADTRITEQTEEAYQPGDDDILGEWEIESRRRNVQIMMWFDRDWQTGFSVRRSEFTGILDESTTAFALERDAGTFFFKGRFEIDEDDLWGHGECYFRANSEYVDEMDALGIELRSESRVLEYALHDITLEYTRGLHEAGYDDLSRKELLTAHIHDVTPEYIQELRELGYEHLRMKALVEMQIHDVEAEFIRELKNLGYDDISQSKLVEMSIHDVDVDYIRDLQDLGYDNLSPSKLVEMSIHDVDADYVRDLAEHGYTDVDTDELVAMQIHDVDPRYVRELEELGYTNLSTDRLVEMQIHDVSTSYIRKLNELGYRNIRPSKLVELSIHDVTIRYIEDLAELGYDDLRLSDLVEMRIHDVTPSFIRKLHRRGLKDLSPDELIDYKIHH